ncbi:hypothetical protein BOS5A_210782 [Bosea sp. EC-HK365B]|nr:hypothetical protein BOS5A_210782 [Bosea sp. EC-HK365B]VXC13219.1 hypothetical protein BOSE127_170284 [Bosea sp. 127]
MVGSSPTMTFLQPDHQVRTPKIRGNADVPSPQDARHIALEALVRRQRPALLRAPLAGAADGPQP